MQVSRKYFPEILPDNEEVYFQHLIGVVESVDELSTLQISKLKESYHFRLAPSTPKYNQMLLEELLKLHNVFNLKLDISKSIKSSGTIVFQINLT
jgi:hypothetical protein